jgi:uncharacterized protein (DUF4213/DUF364 family)
MRQSPISKKVDKMSERELSLAVDKIANDNGVHHLGKWGTSVDNLLVLCEKLEVLGYPRYFAKIKTGAWAVREQQNTQALSRGPTLAIAMCRAIVILIEGKGESYGAGSK